MPLQSIIRELLLNPGEYAVGDASCRMRTVLGSCVSITLWEPQRRVGAMSHFLLAGRASTPGAALDARYGEEALALMLRELAGVGVQAQQCQAKIFGGANMFPEATAPGALHVGRRNGESARGWLRELGIAVQSESLFGCGHRQIVFDVASGDVWSRQVQPSSGFSQLEGE
jgi:chemotaxis protein CheD